MGKLFVYFLVLLCFLSFAVASEYTKVGGINGTYRLDSGVFRSGIVSSTTGAATISSPKNMPLMADLDGDGTQEIIVLDGVTFKIYRGITLQGVASYVSPTLTTYPYFTIYDIDGDGNKEILASSNKNIEILSFNGTSLTRQINYTMSKAGTYNVQGDTILGCRGIDDCFVVGGLFSALASPNQVVGAKFTSSTIYNTGRIYGTAESIYCHPSVPSLYAGDFDADGTSEYVFSMAMVQTSRLDTLIFSIIMNSSNQPTYEKMVLDADLYGTAPAGNNCHEVISGGVLYAGQILTEPLVAEIMNDGGGKELVYGYNNGYSTFKMKSLTSNFDSIRSYPSVYTADGIIISNIMLTDAFVDGAYQDFCVLGMNNGGTKGNRLDLLCGSETTSFSFLGFPTIHSDEFWGDITVGMTNLTANSGRYNNMIHSSEQGFSSGRGDLISSYGIFDIDFHGINALGGSENSTLGLQYLNPHQNAAVVMLDAESNGKTDMVILDATNLFYVNDGFVNSGATITDITTNPCITDVIKVNSTIQINVKVEDYDSDLVSANASFYDSYFPFIQGYNWRDNASSGTTFSFMFVANKTGNNNRLVLKGRDTGNPSDVDSVLEYFNVGVNGVEFGDSECSIYSASVSSSVTTTTLGAGDININNNSITNVLHNQVFQSLGLGDTLIWLIIMVVVAIGVWMYGSHLNPMISLGVIGFVEVILYFVGAFLGFIPLWVLYSTLIIAIIVIGIWVYMMVIHKPSG